MKNYIAKKLKELRKENNYTPEFVVTKLKDYGLEISEKTLYGYENATRQPKADMFLGLCKIYNVKSFNVFWENEIVSELSSQIPLYNELNDDGRTKVDTYVKDLICNPAYINSESPKSKQEKS